MEECIFCKIVSKEIPSTQVWEDENYSAILDLNPNTKGMTLVIPKKHYDSDIFNLSDEKTASFFQAIKTVAKILEKGLRVHRVALVIEGMGVNHLHAKLYPLHGLDGKFSESWSDRRIYFDSYEGYLSTQLGPSLSTEELNIIAAEIRKNQ